MFKPKKIFVVGSSTGEDFENICRNIAESLYSSNFEIIITVAKDLPKYELNTVDVKVVNAVNDFIVKNLPPKPDGTTNHDVPESKKWKVHYYESQQYNPFINPNLPGIAFVRKKFEGKRRYVLMRAIMDADCVLILGGKTTADLIGQLAVLLSKPMLPIPWVAGTSKMLWEEYGSNFDSETSIFLDNGGDDSKKADPDFPVKFIKAIKKILKSNPFDIKEGKVKVHARLLLTLVIITFGSWFWLYSGGINVKDDTLRMAMAFGCVPLSVLMGTILRHGSLQYWRVFFLDLSKSIVISFGLVLIYFYAGYLATGRIASVDPEDFARVSINLSLIGLISGYMLESAQNVLSERLKNHLDKETELGDDST